MDKMNIFEAMNNVDDDLVREAAEENIVSEKSHVVTESNVTVSGVETYRRITWHKIAAIASAVLLIAGVGTGGALMLKNHPPLLEEVTTTTTTEAEDATAVQAKSSKETTEPPTAAAVTEAETKESENKVPTEAEKEERRLTVRAEEKTESPREEDNDSREDEVPAVTTAKVTQQQKTSPANAQTLPKPTTVTTAAIHYPGEKTTKLNENPYRPELRDPDDDIPMLTWYPEDGAWLFNTLSGLSYRPYTCDGIPEGILNGSDGNTYQLNFSDGWIWRNGIEEATMPDEIRQYFIGIAE